MQQMAIMLEDAAQGNDIDRIANNLTPFCKLFEKVKDEMEKWKEMQKNLKA